MGISIFELVNLSFLLLKPLLQIGKFFESLLKDP